MSRYYPIRLVAAVLGVFLLAGCVGGPLGLARFNPVLRDEWKKDEAYGHTNLQRMAEMQNWASQGGSLPAAEQQRIAQQLHQVVTTDANTPLVLQAVRTLGYLPTPAAEEGLNAASQHTNTEVRIVACEAWRTRGGASASEALARMLNGDTDGDVRVAAARQLAGFRDSRSVQALGLALDDPNPALQYRAVESLKAVTGQNLGDNVVAWREYVASGQAKPGGEPTWATRLVSWWR